MTSTFIAIWLVALSLTCTALITFGWAIRSGQFQRLDLDARSIFDADEPEGEVSDHFPNSRRSEDQEAV